jgi:hypothetical protein
MGIYSALTVSKDKKVPNRPVMSDTAPKKDAGGKTPVKKPYSPSPKK